MLFNSWVFVLFFFIVFAFYFKSKHKIQNLILTIASYIFYGAWNWYFLGLIIASTFVDYFLSLKIYNSKDKNSSKKYLFFSLAFNLGMLGFFKYFNFFIDSAYDLANLVGIESTEGLRLNIILPVGISFYTFQTMSYTIDVYKNKIKPITNYLDYSLYVSFFPQLVAGPIERAHHLIPQIIRERSYSLNNLRSGLWLITWGFFKKVVVADNLARIVDSAFNGGIPDNGLVALIGVYAFAYQIYGDFSGYSDIARGVSKILGFDLMLNFKIPYISKNPQEFWNRWHISLSTWLRDYLYIPLGGNQFGQFLTYRNLIITMVLGGLWHGAAWTFILWGIYQGALLAIHRLIFGSYRNKVQKGQSFGDVLRIIGMFHLTCLGWLIFRAESISQIKGFLLSIFSGFTIDATAISGLFNLFFFAGSLWIIEFFVRNVDDLKELKYYKVEWATALISVIWISIYLLSPGRGQAFIYFQF